MEKGFFLEDLQMKLRIPDYYKDFQCLADKCKDSCCIGWEINIDEETLEYYKTVPGKFGKRLNEQIVEEDGETSFVLHEGRCAFLNAQNLCDICIDLGETALCEICLEYPRFTLEYGNVREKCLGLSCEEVGRLVFEKKESVCFVETIMEEQYEWSDENEEYEEEYEEMDETEYPYLEKVRDFAIQILQERKYGIEERACILLRFAVEVQEAMNERKFAQFDKVIAKYEDIEQNMEQEMKSHKDPISFLDDKVSSEERFDLYKMRMEIYETIEILDQEWEQVYQSMQELFTTPDKYQASHHKLAEYYENRENDYEQLLVYFVFRYGMKAVYDYNFIEKIKFALMSFLVIRDMDAERFFRDGKFGLEERIDVARIYSKEVEHSEDNLETLAEACVFEDAFQTELMLKSI